MTMDVGVIPSRLKQYRRLLISVALVAVASVVLAADGTACCGCDEEGCTNLFTCNQIIVELNHDCCGISGGTSSCNDGDWCTFCPGPPGGSPHHCGNCQEGEPPPI